MRSCCATADSKRPRTPSGCPILGAGSRRSRRRPRHSFPVGRFGPFPPARRSGRHRSTIRCGSICGGRTDNVRASTRAMCRSAPELSTAARCGCVVGLRRACDRRARAGPHRRGNVRVGGRRRALPLDGIWKQYRFTLRPATSNPLAKLTALRRPGPGMDGSGVPDARAMPWTRSGPTCSSGSRLSARLRPLARRERRAGLSLDVGRRAARRASRRGSTWHGRTSATERLRYRRVHRFCRTLGAEPHSSSTSRGRRHARGSRGVGRVHERRRASKYGAMRAENGHREPFNVRTWELGNEIWGDWVRGHSTPDLRAQLPAVPRSDAGRRSVDRFIASAATTDWNDQLLALAGRRSTCCRSTTTTARRRSRSTLPGGAAAALGGVLPRSGAAIVALRRARHQADLNEWNLALPVPRQHSMESALYAARLMNVFERRATWSHDRRVRSGERLAGRHHPGRPPRCLRHADVSGRAAVQQHLGRSARRPELPPRLGQFKRREAGCRARHRRQPGTDGRRLFVKAVDGGPDAAMKTSVR